MYRAVAALLSVVSCMLHQITRMRATGQHTKTTQNTGVVPASPRTAHRKAHTLHHIVRRTPCTTACAYLPRRPAEGHAHGLEIPIVRELACVRRANSHGPWSSRTLRLLGGAAARRHGEVGAALLLELLLALQP